MAKDRGLPKPYFSQGMVIARATTPLTIAVARAIRHSTTLRAAAHIRGLHRGARYNADSAIRVAAEDASNPALSFPCLDALEARTATLASRSLSSGPEPSYATGNHLNYHSQGPILLGWGGVLPGFNIAYETWGSLNQDKSNAILLHTGLSASSHTHSTDINPKLRWWEKFIGSGAPLDTKKYFVICTNVIGGCYGSTGPSLIQPTTSDMLQDFQF